MNIDEAISLLPIELVCDSYFQSVISFLRDKYRDNNINIIKIEVAPLIYSKLSDKESWTLAQEDEILQIVFILGNSFYSLGIKKQANYYHVYYETQEKERTSRTILVKTDNMSIVETKKVTKVDGIYQEYDVNVYYYDRDYNEIEIDTTDIKNQMFSDEFGIPLEDAEYYRDNFFRYQEYLSKSATRTKMISRASGRSAEDYYLFRSPFKGSFKEFFLRDYIEMRDITLKKYLHKNHGTETLRFIDRLDNLLAPLIKVLGVYDEAIISDVIYQDLIPVLAGMEAYAVDTKGVVVKRVGDDYTLYYVHLRDDGLDYQVQSIDREMVCALMEENKKNSEVVGLDNFIVKRTR